MHAVFLLNRIPTRLLDDKSPFQSLHDKLLDVASLKVFGSLCYVSSLTSQRGKFDNIAHKCAFLGYKDGTKGFVAYELATKKIQVSRHVMFYEHGLPCGLQHASNSKVAWQYIDHIPSLDPDLALVSPASVQPSVPVVHSPT